MLYHYSPRQGGCGYHSAYVADAGTGKTVFRAPKT